MNANAHKFAYLDKQTNGMIRRALPNWRGAGTMHLRHFALNEGGEPGFRRPPVRADDGVAALRASRRARERTAF